MENERTYSSLHLLLKGRKEYRVYFRFQNQKTGKEDLASFLSV
jgi:hypothetical protein